MDIHTQAQYIFHSHFVTFTCHEQSNVVVLLYGQLRNNLEMDWIIAALVCCKKRTTIGTEHQPSQYTYLPVRRVSEISFSTVAAGTASGRLLIVTPSQQATCYTCCSYIATCTIPVCVVCQLSPLISLSTQPPVFLNVSLHFHQFGSKSISEIHKAQTKRIIIFLFIFTQSAISFLIQLLLNLFLFFLNFLSCKTDDLIKNQY